MNNNNIMSNIGIAFVGTISAGKTTLLNALFTEPLGDTHIIKTTILPHIYREVDTNYHDKQYIKDNTAMQNTEFTENFHNNNLGKLQEVNYNIRKLTDFVNFQKDVNCIYMTFLD